MTRKRLALAAGAVLLAAVAFALVRLDAMAGVAAGYKAKIACSELFLARRDALALLEREFDGISPAVDRVRLRIDSENRSVSGSLFGLGRARAVFRDGYGCTLARGAPAPAAPLAAVADRPLAEAFQGTPAARADVDYAAIDRALDAAFADQAAQTRALLVVRDGAVVAERYAEGFSRETPFLSWSMAKSVTATMVGAAALHGLVETGNPLPVAEWRAKDPRSAITWNDALQMQTGLSFDETYADPLSDATQMLFRAGDAGRFAARKGLAHPPGAAWSYSSGTSNLLQRSLRAALESRGVDYHRFAREALFEPLGAASFVMEPDASGTFIGSSFIYATARDWAKLGLLYLNDGVADGRRLLPEGWSRYVATPASASDGVYGAQFWLNRPGANGREQYMPGVSDDAYLMAGHEGQYVVIIPERRLVIVRTGMTRGPEPMTIVAPTFAAIAAAVQ